MKKTIFWIIFLSQLLLSQQLSKKHVINNNSYYYGTGYSSIREEARDKALAELSSQIAVRVSSTFKEKIRESKGDIIESTKHIIETHTAALLKNVKFQTKKINNNQFETFCYLHKNEVSKIFNERRKLISDMVNNAKKYENEYNYSYALKYYYFANILLNSLPEQEVNYKGTNFTTLIPDRINNIILKTEFEYLEESDISKNEREIKLRVHSQGHPISLLDFTFWDGSDHVTFQAKDGIANIRLYGSSTKLDKLVINIKYQNYNSKREYWIIDDLWKVVNHPAYDTQKIVHLYQKKLGGLVKTSNTIQGPKNFNIKLKTTNRDSPPIQKICQQTKQLLKTLNQQNRDQINSSYGYDYFLKNKVLNYIKHNNPVPQEKNVGGYINKTESGWEVRRIRMLHRYPSISKKSTEYLVLDFSKNGNLRDINVAITKQLYNKFIREAEFGKDWDNRQQIIKFIEKYRTAYICRDIQRVKQMFAENALIIVGRRIESKAINPEKMYNSINGEPKYEYLRLKKKEYIRRQKWIFNYQEDIFLDFASFEISRKNDQPNIYGVEMRQNYYSTTYSDEGYLFLLIDFAPENPTIYVRAWQPNEWNEDKLIRSSNIKVRK